MKTFVEVSQSACALLAGTDQQPLTPREASILAMLKPFANPQESNPSDDPGCAGCNHIPCICTTSVNASNTALLGNLQRRLAEVMSRLQRIFPGEHGVRLLEYFLEAFKHGREITPWDRPLLEIAKKASQERSVAD